MRSDPPYAIFGGMSTVQAVDWRATDNRRPVFGTLNENQGPAAEIADTISHFGSPAGGQVTNSAWQESHPAIFYVPTNGGAIA